MKQVNALVKRISKALRYVIVGEDLVTTQVQYFDDDPYHPRYPASIMILSMDDILLASS
jgi:hypothetical protein